MRDLEIRRARAEELPDAVGVWERSRWDAQAWLEERMGHTHEDNMRYFCDVVARENEVWLAVEGAEIVGLLAIGGRQIDQLYVEPERQGEGVGSALIGQAKELSPRGLTLFTHQRNKRAQKFYQHHGFRVVRMGVSPPPECEPDVSYAWKPDPES